MPIPRMLPCPGPRTARPLAPWLLLFLVLRLGAQELVFDPPAAARERLVARDAFLERLSHFDRAARMKTNGPVDEAVFRQFLSDSVLEWSPAQQQRIRDAFDQIREGLRKTGAPLPGTIHLVQTTGREEGNAPYTRGEAIILPTAVVGKQSSQLPGILAHEVFHLVSRANPGLRDQLYALIGFEPCGEIPHPPSLAARRITNPDAPINAHAIEVVLDDVPVRGIPILFANAPEYDTARGGEFFAYLTFELLLLERTQSGGFRPVVTADGPRLVPIAKVTGFHEKIGRNTRYILHPEEVLADNFSLLVQGATTARSPELLDRIRTVLQARKPTGQDPSKP